MTVKVTVEVCDIEPLDPVTVMVYVPVGVEDCVPAVSVDDALDPDESVTLDGVSDTDGPEGEETPERVILPENPFTLVIVTVDDAEDPTLVERLVGLEEIVKSGDWVVGAKNSDMAFALASFDVRDARFQLVSIVFVRE